MRGAAYLSDRVKSDSGPALFDVMHVDVFTSHDKIGNVAQRRDSWLRKARDAGDDRYYLVIAYITPQPPHVHMIVYLAVSAAKLASNPRVAKLWKQFTTHGEAADAFRNERWKVIPRIAEGAWVVQKAVGTKPALLAQKLTHTWIFCDETTTSPTAAGSTPGTVPAVTSSDAMCAPGMEFRARGGSFVTHSGPGPYLEADCDVGSSSMAYWLVGLLQQYAKHVVIDLGFTIEPREEDTLPEVILGAVRLSRVELSRTPVLTAFGDDWVLGKMGFTHADLEDA